MDLRKAGLAKTFIIAVIVAVSAAVTGCSTQENNSRGRWFHAFHTRYNIYYNGAQAYINGSLEKETANKDNFTEVLPLYYVGNKDNRETGQGNFERAIEKSQKAIKLHSIKRKPEWNKSRRKTDKDREWLSRKEYNPFLWKAWMLMGRSQFHSGAFDDAASTFSYMSRIYQTQPAIYGRARAWLAKCYVEQGWLYDAEDVIRNMQRDSIHWRAQKEWDYTLADYYIHTGDYAAAVPYLRKVIKHEMRRKQRAREWYIMGQLQTALGNKEEATRAYKRVIRQNPPYELAFNARIAMTEVLSEGQSKKMIGRLKRMARSDNNKDYLDQVYYALGNIYLNDKDTANAISAYEKGNTKSTRSGIEKGVLLLRLGDLYWDMERYNDAQRCYGEAIGLLDKERKDYEQLSNRSKVLDELVPHTDAVYLQDSLQALAKMSEADRNAAIDRVIEALKKKEKEEKQREAELAAKETLAEAGAAKQADETSQTTSATQSSTWYFYNATAVSQGKKEFQQIWGTRTNADDWRRSNKTVVATPTTDDEEENLEDMTEEQLDSIAREKAAADSIAQLKENPENDPHRREYYLKQIPFTEEQLAASNEIIMEGLYNAAVIFKDKLDNLPRSEKLFQRLVDSYPSYTGMADVYYHLFLLYSRKGMPATADGYVTRLSNEYPESQWTTLLTDPYFEENARFGVHMEDSLYAATYDAFKANRFGEIRGNTHISETRFPLGANRDKFLFIGGLSKLNAGDGDGCLEDMKAVVEKYPNSRLSEIAGMIVNGVKAGRTLRGGTFDIGNVWERRAIALSESDSTAAKEFTTERNIDFVYMIAYEPDSVDANRLLYELARYNFTSYMVRNFDITVEGADGLQRMVVAGFRSYDEVLQYARQLHAQESVMTHTAGCRRIIISAQNLPLLGTTFSYDDYDAFYNEHFAPLKVSDIYLLAEPSEITTARRNEPTVEDIDRLLDDGFFPDDETTGGGGTTMIIEDESDDATTTTEELLVPDETATTTADKTTVIDEQNEPEQVEMEPETQHDNTLIEEPEEPTTATESAVVELEPAATEIEPAATETETLFLDDEYALPDDDEMLDDGGGIIPDDYGTAPEAENITVETETIIVEEEGVEAAREATFAPIEESTSNPIEEPEEPQRQATQTATQPQDAPTQPQSQPESPQKQDADDLEEMFYFDEDEPATPATGASKRRNAYTEEGLDDEYYDLDGF